MTPTQKKIFALLGDGQKHSREEIHACLPDELSAKSAIWYHISKLRKHIKHRGLDVVCELGRSGITYRLIRPYICRK